tara:strand:- start:765 stop:1472 length:708 start_codon:yes stop_codon:yes gene_type:complete
MALPKLNTSPEYFLTIPSTGQEVKYRPYLVREEKVLMMAAESQDEKQMFNAIINTLKACIKDNINENQLAIFDVEYMFTQVRSKSTGELIKLQPKCESCEKDNHAAIKLDDLKVNMPKELNNVIKLTDNISVKMRWPSYRDVVSGNYKPDEQTKTTFLLLGKCIDTIMTNEEQISMIDVPEKETQEFIEDMTSDQFTKLSSFLEKMPRLKHTIEFNCTGCGKENKLTLEGLQAFF